MRYFPFTIFSNHLCYITVFHCVDEVPSNVTLFKFTWCLISSMFARFSNELSALSSAWLRALLMDPLLDAKEPWLDVPSELLLELEDKVLIERLSNIKERGKSSEFMSQVSWLETSARFKLMCHDSWIHHSNSCHMTHVNSRLRPKIWSNLRLFQYHARCSASDTWCSPPGCQSVSYVCHHTLPSQWVKKSLLAYLLSFDSKAFAWRVVSDSCHCNLLFSSFKLCLFPEKSKIEHSKMSKVGQNLWEIICNISLILTSSLFLLKDAFIHVQGSTSNTW